MIGKITIGKSFRGCLSYCLEDKKQGQEPAGKNRAEILCFNQCFGDKKELIRQFNELRDINPKLSKPVLHITLSLSPGEKLSSPLLRDIINDCATEMGFENNQYVAMQHHDTEHQHIHIVVNRVGFDGRTLKDNNNYQKIAACCRKIELDYSLKEVLSPRRFLSKEFRKIPRIDARKENLRQCIASCLSLCGDYAGFKKMMNQRGYELIKARGISFLDKKKVKIKGSEVGYSLQTIEKLLALKLQLRLPVIEQKEQQQQQLIQNAVAIQRTVSIEQRWQRHKALSSKNAKSPELHLETGMRNDPIDHHLLKKRKRKKRSQHL